MSASGSTSGAQKTGSPSRTQSPSKAGRSGSRSGSAAGGESAKSQGFDPATYPLRDKEGISKRLEMPPEAYFHVSSNNR
jgi:eukaryotic translation initiation factor 2C